MSEPDRDSCNLLTVAGAMIMNGYSVFELDYGSCGGARAEVSFGFPLPSRTVRQSG